MHNIVIKRNIDVGVKVELNLHKSLFRVLLLDTHNTKMIMLTKEIRRSCRLQLKRKKKKESLLRKATIPHISTISRTRELVNCLI